MTCLNISIEIVDGLRLEVLINNLRREDATELEIAHTNILETAIATIVKGMAETIVKFEKNQSGPMAENETIKS